MKKLLALFLALALVLTACGPQKSQEQKEESQDASQAPVSEEAKEEDSIIKIGVSPTPHAPIVEVIKDKLAQEGITLEIQEFEDYIIPNQALEAGDLDANFFQHEPYLQNFNKEYKTKLVSLGAVHLEPIAAYSNKYYHLEDLPQGAKVLIPNDVTNGARALLLLEKEGLIRLDDPSNSNVTEENIVDNPKNLEFIPLEAAMLARTHEDSDLAIINSNYALDAGLNPLKNGIAIEGQDSPYANIVAVREGEETKEKFQKLIQALQSEDVKKFIEEEYQGAIIPAF